MTIISLKDIYKIYGDKDNKCVALNGISIDINQGDFLSIMGPSGS
ncbi:Bacitracin export ATP-binding protein BceA [Clostridium sp. N3C]|nr:Bacitracin export ATP-binding protein BceA [Clostridium sp. N3C]